MGVLKISELDDERESEYDRSFVVNGGYEEKRRGIVEWRETKRIWNWVERFEGNEIKYFKRCCVKREEKRSICELRIWGEESVIGVEWYYERGYEVREIDCIRFKISVWE